MADDVKRECSQCGGEIPANRRANAKYCSVACLYEAAHAVARKAAPAGATVCRRCGAPMKASPAGIGRPRRYCSVACAREAKAQQQRAKEQS